MPVDLTKLMNPTLSAVETLRIDQPISVARGLPNRAYTSSAWARNEIATLLGKYWTCIGFETDLPLSAVKPIELLGLPLLMVRDAQGVVRVFHNVCRHRGHRLVAKPGLIKVRLRCPYHSWTYDLEGGLQGTPHIGGPNVHECAEFDRTKADLFSVRTATWLGMVFVNLSANATSLDQYLKPVCERWEQFVGPGGWSELAPDPDGVFELTVRANWKLAVENYCESYHLPIVHPGLNSYSKLEDHYAIYGTGMFAGQGTNVFTYGEKTNIVLPSFPNWPIRTRAYAEYIALFPNVLLGLQRDHFYCVVLEPAAHDRTVERAQLYYVGSAAHDLAHAAARATVREGWSAVFREDVSVVEGMQAGRASPAYDGGIFSPAMDGPTHWFHKWVAAQSQPAQTSGSELSGGLALSE